MRLPTVTGTVIAALLVFGAVPAFSQQEARPDADNTRVNKQDRSRSEPTADQAKNNRSDREIMRDIRKSLMDDKALSSNAHNTKIIAQNGKVTLKGPVNSEEEKRSVEEKAREVAGADNVTSELTVKAARSK